MSNRGRIGFVVVFAVAVSGCGLRVPSLQNYGNDIPAEKADENLIINQLKCEIHQGIYSTVYDPNFYPPSSTTGKSPDWLLTWGAKVSLVLTADEKGSFNPGLSYKNPFQKMGTFASVSGGLQSSAEAQRKETIAVTYAFSDLMKEALSPNGCSDGHGVLIHSDLRIGEFISNKIFLTRVPGTIPGEPKSIDASSKPLIMSAFSDEITFILTYGGSVTPSWNFVRLSVDPTSPLLSATRTKTQYVTITLGPVAPSSPTQAAKLEAEADELNNANLIGHAVATALQNFRVQTTQ
jgi:hypothetical protein